MFGSTVCFFKLCAAQYAYRAHQEDKVASAPKRNAACIAAGKKMLKVGTMLCAPLTHLACMLQTGTVQLKQHARQQAKHF